MELTARDVAKMSDVQVREMNAQLGKQIVKKFFAFQVVKWTLIWSIGYAANRMIKDADPKPTTK
jgi:hypothetical protein